MIIKDKLKKTAILAACIVLGFVLGVAARTMVVDVRVCCEVTGGLCFAVEHDSQCPVENGGYVLGTCRYGLSLPDGTIECLED